MAHFSCRGKGRFHAKWVNHLHAPPFPPPLERKKEIGSWKLAKPSTQILSAFSDRCFPLESLESLVSAHGL